MIQQAPFRDRWNISLATSNKSESPEERQGACHNSEDPHPLHELSLKVAKILTDKTPWYQDQICFHLASRTVEPEGFHQATISQNAVVSPAEFHLLLINEQAKLHTLLHLLQELYSDETHSLSEDLIQPQVSCVARMADNTWQRALIQHVGNDEVSLMFVDFGITQFCPFRDVKPLWIEFGKLHPFALHSTLFRLEKTELWLVKIQQFKDILEELHYTVVVQFVRRSVGSGMYEVSLFNSGLEDMFKRKFCYIRRGREQWDYSYVARRRDDQVKKSECTDGPPGLERTAKKFFQKPTKSAKVLKKKPKKLSSSEDEGDNFYEEIWDPMRPSSPMMPFVNEVPKKTDLLDFSGNSAEPVVETQGSEEIPEIKKGEGFITDLYASWGSVCSADFPSSVLLKPRLLKKYYSADLASGFKPGDKVKVEAIKVSMPFNEFDGKYDEPLPVGFSDTDIKEILAMSEQFVRSETQEIWVATAISILESSRVPSTVGSAVVTKVTRNYGVLAAIKTPFHQEDLGPIYFDHKSLLKIPVDMMEIMGIDELFVRQQLVDFKAVEMEPSVDSCKWLAISVAPSGEVIEAVGMICHYDDQKDFGFVAFLPKIADEKQQEVTLENISRKKNWDRSANSRQNYPFNFCNHLVYFHRTSVQFPIPKYPAATFNSFHQDYPTGSHTGENSVDQPLEDSSRNNVSKSFSLLKSFDSGYLSKSQEWVGKLVRFRACKEVGGKYWDWRATLVEVLEDRNDLNVDVKDAIKAPQISIFNWVERYARVEPHVKAAVVECVKLAENDSNIEFATQRSHSSSQVLTSMSFPIEEFLTNKLVELKLKLKGRHPIDVSGTGVQAETLKVIENDKLFEAFTLLCVECPNFMAPVIDKLGDN